ncbi:MAG TPA: carbamate kinase [Petrotogaceae bacterium]|nr:carbamate kinase [Petrotogaceae bacterium]
MNKKLAVVAIGGNAVNRPGESPTAENMIKAVRTTASYLADMIQMGYSLIVTHGNGPQVGNILIQQDLAKDTIPPFPMDLCGSMTQGYLGYMIAQELHNIFIERKIKKEVCTVVSQVVVDENDDGFKNPSKPVGPFYSAEYANKMHTEKGWTVKEDSGRGWRKVVPSPIPEDVIEKDAIKNLIEKDYIVVAAGGGGIPVVRQSNGMLKGVEAVIDKDRASALLAGIMNADELIILTAVEKVCLNYNKPDQKELDTLTLAQAQEYISQGHFAKGSMLPKIQACVDFVRNTGKPALITDMEKLKDALAGKTGTKITR